MPRLPACEARKLMAAAVRECVSIPSIAQVVLYINEAGQHKIVKEFLHDERLRQALMLIRKNS